MSTINSNGIVSLISDFNLIKGNSTDIYLLSIKGVYKLSPEWIGEYNIVDVDNNIIIHGDLMKNEGIENEPDGKYFIFQLVPSQTDLLEAGKKYKLHIKVYNETIYFNKEIVQATIKVLKNGI